MPWALLVLCLHYTLFLISKIGPAEIQFHVFPTVFFLQSENKFFHSCAAECYELCSQALKPSYGGAVSALVPLPHLPSGQAVISDKFLCLGLYEEYLGSAPLELIRITVCSQELVLPIEHSLGNLSFLPEW